MSEEKSLQGIDVTATMKDEWWDILTPEALEFVADLQRTFNGRRLELLEARTRRQQKLDSGAELDFLAETADIRAGDWKIAPVPDDLQDRRVEITGPPSRKMVINALNSGAKVFMADFEDSNAPTWANCLDGQINMRDAVRRTIRLETAKKTYELSDSPAVLMVRPRGWHLSEKNVLVDGERMSGSLFDFGLYLFHNAKEASPAAPDRISTYPSWRVTSRLGCGTTCSFAPRSASACPSAPSRPRSSSRPSPRSSRWTRSCTNSATTLPDSNCGRWDYIFSFIKRHQSRPDFVMPDRALVTMTRHNMHSYSKLAIKTCHRRGAHAMGGMAAQIPIKNDPEANEAALAKVRADKERESRDGHDGTWVAHPGLVPIAMEIFDREMPRPNQLDVLREDVEVTAADLLDVPAGTSPRPDCASTSTSAFSISRRGSAATAACPSTTSWRTPRRPRSREPRSGSGFVTAPRSLTAESSPPISSARSWMRNSRSCATGWAPSDSTAATSVSPRNSSTAWPPPRPWRSSSPSPPTSTWTEEGELEQRRCRTRQQAGAPEYPVHRNGSVRDRPRDRGPCPDSVTVPGPGAAR
jgi:malate synthase